MPQREKLLPLIDACRLAGVEYRVAWQGIAAGSVNAVREGRRWLVDPAELRKLGRERQAERVPA